MAKQYRLPKRLIDIHNHLHGDDDGSAMLQRMDAAGIEVTLIMGSPLRGEEGNRLLVKACRRWPDRYVGGAYYDPREGKTTIRRLKHYNAEGLRIVKLFPNLGYFPDDDALRPFWQTVAELRMGVLSHCGWLGGSGAQMRRDRWAAYYSHPGRFEKVIRACPDTPFIMAHFGGIAGVLESVMLATRTPNTFIDCSPGQGLWAIEACGAIAGSVPPHKLMWGSDVPNPGDALSRYRTALVRLKYGPHLPAIFFDNAAGLLDTLGVLPRRLRTPPTKPHRARPKRK